MSKPPLLICDFVQSLFPASFNSPSPVVGIFLAFYPAASLGARRSANTGLVTRLGGGACWMIHCSSLDSCVGPRLKVSLSILPVNWNGSL